MKRCPECGTPLGMVPFKRDCKFHAFVAGLENVQAELDALEEPRREAMAETENYAWDMFMTGKDW